MKGPMFISKLFQMFYAGHRVSHGDAQVSQKDGLIIYTPEPKYHGDDSMVYKVCNSDVEVIISGIAVSEGPTEFPSQEQPSSEPSDWPTAMQSPPATQE
ncbi:MAG: hypothetical protein SGBAC_009953, partial [Bacillariaceae sp.]